MSHERVLITEQCEFKTDLQVRINDALRKPPVDGIFAVGGKLLPYYNTANEKVNHACSRHAVCNHGFENHLIPVIQNALTLSDIAQTGIHDGIWIPPILLHDLVYGINGLQWNDYTIDSHEKIAVRYLEKLKCNYLHELIDLDNASVQQSLELLHKWSPLYREMIGKNTKEMVVYTENLAKSEVISSEMLFPSLVMLSDKLDYYRRERLIGLKHHENNRYFDYSYAVSRYVITEEENTISYIVQLDGMGIAEWYEGTKALYPDVWRLGEAFATVLGKEFVVQEAA